MTEPSSPAPATPRRQNAAAEGFEGTPFLQADSRLAREASRSTFIGVATPGKKVIRTDPAMLTCFDPADRELYDLWAPTRA
ncbi:hypothetical protein CYLTODRAFT_448274 [Cylindrobasidium torrendii FP15055 ss-10]|uniref:Uncharacterized protein n=1 Tax=Cylindrobasidium torrendii FP15055 ss-10 TaxID=1314674 RepID=A0A0D7BU53_9AGAR|nr:hypothetical protein CYLTODRAFT_448274 [Cylindrobasidium torrendii FP15055 ss-10]